MWTTENTFPSSAFPALNPASLEKVNSRGKEHNQEKKFYITEDTPSDYMDDGIAKFKCIPASLAEEIAAKRANTSLQLAVVNS